jgi:hypothetical protein
MATYKKSSGTSGKWAKASELVDIKTAKIVSETQSQPSQFKDKNGKEKTQDVAKVQFAGIEEPMNVSVNRATIDALVDAYGEDSKDWQGHDLRVDVQSALVGGRWVHMLFLVPPEYERSIDANGYMVITKKLPSLDTEGKKVPF